MDAGPMSGLFPGELCLTCEAHVSHRVISLCVRQQQPDSQKRCFLRKGAIVVEATSGNALSYFGKQKGYKARVVMPENMTEERKELVRSLFLQEPASPNKVMGLDILVSPFKKEKHAQSDLA